MSSKRIADLPVKNPIDAMKIPTGGFGDYAITLKILSDWLVNKYSLATKEELENLQVLLLEKIDEEFKNLDVYTKGETDTLIRNVKESLESEIAKLSTRVSENKTRLDNLGTTSKYSVETLPTSKPTEDFVKKSISDLNLGSAGQKDVDFFAEQQKQADKVVLKSGRNVESKLSDNLSPIDYGAKGDGVTDDTQAFIDFEKSVQGREVDLLGKVYKTTQDFTRNYYKNGIIKQSNTVTEKKGLTTEINTTYKINGGNGFEVGWLRAKHPNNTFDYSSRTIIQGIAFDVKNNHIYAQTTFDGDAGKTETSRILRYAMGTYPNLTDPIKSFDCGTVVGHQNIGLTFNNGNPVFWSTCGTAIDNRALHVAQFTLNEDTSGIKNIKYFQIWSDSKHVLNASRSMAISPNGAILASINALQSDNTWLIRTFKTSIFSENGDYSNQYLYEFPIMNRSRSVQSLATDGKHVYIHHGGSADKDGIIDIYTIDGVLVATDFSFTMGKETIAKRVMDGTSTSFYEDEVLTFVPYDGAWIFGSVVATGRTENWFNNSILTFENQNPKLVGSNVIEVSTDVVLKKRLSSGGLTDNFTFNVPVQRIERSFSTPYTRYIASAQNSEVKPTSSVSIAQIQASIPKNIEDKSEIIKGQIQAWYEVDGSMAWNITANNASNTVGASLAVQGAGRVAVTTGTFTTPTLFVQRSGGAPYTRFVASSLNNETAPASSTPLAQMQVALPTSISDKADVVRGQIQAWYGTDKSVSWNMFATDYSNTQTAAVAIRGGTSEVAVTGNLVLKPSKTVSPTNNGELTFEATSDTSLTVKLKGSDGVVRSAVLTLA